MGWGNSFTSFNTGFGDRTQGDLRGLFPDNTVYQASEEFSLAGVLTPPALTADVNNYAPVGIENASVLRIDPGAGANITGLSGGKSGRIIVIQHIGSGTSYIQLTNNDGSSIAANRFKLENHFYFLPNWSVALQYDATSQRWRLLQCLPITTQLFQEAVQSGIFLVTTGMQKYHPGSAKAHVEFDASSGTPTVGVSYNVSSITDNAAGDFTVNFSTSFSSANYAAACVAGHGGTCSAPPK